MSTDTELTLDVGQANELKLAFRRAGYTNAEIKRLCEGDLLSRLLPVIKGHAEVTMIRYIIDCDVRFIVPHPFGIKKHIKGGEVEWDPTKVQLYLSEDQRDGELIQGHKLHKKLTGKPVLNACVLDYLIAYPELIPDRWKGKRIFFWGTIYRNPVDRLLVRYIFWDGVKWSWAFHWLNNDWYLNDPAALLASD